MPGCAVGVVQSQALAYANGYGMANLDYNLPITPTSNFYLGSVGKQFTAAAVAHAVRAGYLSLDDPIQKWLPQMPEYERTITIRNLIHHTSGIRDYLGLWNLSGKRLEDVHSVEETLELIARQRNSNFATTGKRPPCIARDVIGDRKHPCGEFRARLISFTSAKYS